MLQSICISTLVKLHLLAQKACLQRLHRGVAVNEELLVVQSLGEMQHEVLHPAGGTWLSAFTARFHSAPSADACTSSLPEQSRETNRPMAPGWAIVTWFSSTRARILKVCVAHACTFSLSERSRQTNEPMVPALAMVSWFSTLTARFHKARAAYSCSFSLPERSRGTGERMTECHQPQHWSSFPLFEHCITDHERMNHNLE